MKNLKMFSLIASLLVITSCVPSQHRLDFDLSRNALVSCDESSKLRRVTIEEKGEGNFYRIVLDKDSKGSSVIYFDKENKGYYCNTEYPIKLKPDKEYVISSVSLDSRLEMSVFTNSEGKIDSVANPLGCLKED